MPSKRDILRHLTHDELLNVAMLSSIEVSTGDQAVDRGSRQTALYQVLKGYSLERLKRLCQAVGIDASGEDKSRITERLIWTGTAQGGGDAQSFGGVPLRPVRRAGSKSQRARIEAVAARESFRIDFPNVVGFAISNELLRCDVDKVDQMELQSADLAADVVWTPSGWVIAAGSSPDLKGERLSRALPRKVSDRRQRALPRRLHHGHPRRP